MATSYCRFARTVRSLKGRDFATTSSSTLGNFARVTTIGHQLTRSRANSSTTTNQTPTGTPNQEAKPHPILSLPAGDEGTFRERFIPLSRRSLVRMLIQEEGLLASTDQERLEALAVSLDNAIINQYYGVLLELKQLFEPVNPDKDTVMTRFWRQKDILDSEFWLLRKLAVVMAKANFHELPKHVVDKALSEHLAGEGVNVSVDAKNYQILKFWALGKELPKQKIPLYKRLLLPAFYRVTRRQPPAPVEYYKRVVVAVRPRNENKLILKMFKEIPVGGLEQLLPDGKIQMTRWDQGVLATAVAIGSLSLLVKGVTLLAEVKLNWTLITASVTGLVVLNAWNKYKNRRTRYAMELAKTLYFKNVANNRGLLTLLVDRAQEESFKEALLTYVFLLASQPSTLVAAPGTEDGSNMPVSLGGIPASVLERKVESWVYGHSKATVEFDCLAGVRLLETFGLLRRDEEDNLSVVAMDTALHSLPRQPISMVARDDEPEMEESYDREMFENEVDYKKEEKRHRKRGWD